MTKDIFGDFANNSYFQDILASEKKKSSLQKDFTKDLSIVKDHLTSTGYFDTDGNFNESRA